MVSLKFNDYTTQKYIRIEDFHEGLAAVQNEEELWGFINKEGKEVIPCQFSNCKDFSEGLAAVQNEEELWGFINKEGVTVITSTYRKANSFKEGFALVLIGFDFYQYIDKNGNPLTTDGLYYKASDYCEGYALVKEKGTRRKFYLDKKGNLFGPYDSASPFYHGIAFIEDKKSKKICTINQNFEIVNQIPNDDIKEICSYSEGIINIKDACRFYGYLDTSLKPIAPIMYPKASCFRDGVAVVDLCHGFISIVDKSGKTLVLSTEFQYEAVENFSEGLAAAQHPNGLWGFVNKEGKEVIPCQYKNVGRFSEGLTWVLDTNDIYYYIDKTGKKTIELDTTYHSTLELDDEIIHLEEKSEQELQNKKLQVLSLIKEDIIKNTLNQIDQLAYQETTGLYVEGITRRKTPQQNQHN